MARTEGKYGSALLTVYIAQKEVVIEEVGYINLDGVPDTVFFSAMQEAAHISMQCPSVIVEGQK